MHFIRMRLIKYSEYSRYFPSPNGNSSRVVVVLHSRVKASRESKMFSPTFPLPQSIQRPSSDARLKELEPFNPSKESGLV